MEATTVAAASSAEAAAAEASIAASAPVAEASLADAAIEERPGRSRRSRITSLVLIVATAAVIIAVAVLANQPAKSLGDDGLTSVNLTGAAGGAAPEVGKPAPDFTARAADGTKVTLSDLKGHPVWLTFGASWCQPCRAEAPDIQSAYADFKAKGGEIVQVFLSEDSAAVKDYAGRVGLTYVKVPDPDTAIASEYRILGIPSHFFIASDGTLQSMKVGSLDPDKIKAALAEIGG